MQKGKNSRGFTLIEMIVAFAILGVAVLAIGGFMITGIRSYSSVNAETVVQNEAQTALNEVQEIVIDAGLGVSYNVVTGTSGSHTDHFVETDSVTGSVYAKYLYVFNWDNTGNAVEALIIKWDSEEKALYYTEVTNIQNTTVSGTDVSETIAQALPVDSITNWDILAEGVQTFSIDMSAYKDTNKITAALSMIKQGKTYESSLIITLRNNVLINPENIAAIYERKDVVINTVITGVTLTTSSNTILKGADLQLTTKVTGKGYPSQTIHRWLIESVDGVTYSTNADNETVATDVGTVTTLYDSSTSTDSDLITFNSATKVLSLSESNDLKMLKITAIVNGRNEDNEIVQFSDTKYVDVKDISNFAIQPDVSSSSIEGNNLANDWAEASTGNRKGASTPVIGSEDDATPIMNLYPGNLVQMKATVTGTNINSEDTTVIWRIMDQKSGVNVTVSDAGKISVSRTSQQGWAVLKAYPELNTNMCLYYIINVGTQYGDGNNGLQITGKTTVNRGGSIQFGLQLNGYDYDTSELNDFNWTCKLVDAGTVTGNPVTISESGKLSVAESMSFDYDFVVEVVASMKSNSDVQAMALVKIPRVTMQMTKPTVISQRGSVIAYNTFSCIVTGIETYTLDWTLASETNPTYYGSTAGNGSYITGKGDTCSVSISGKEPSTLSYLRARATLHGYSNYRATTLISLQTLDMSVSASNKSMNRGESNTLTAALSNKAFTGNDVAWTIDRVYYGSTGSETELSTTESGIGLTSTNGLTTDLKVDSSYHRLTQTIYAKVTATAGGTISKSLIIEINPSTPPTITVKVSNLLRGGSITLEASEKDNLTWEITNVSRGSAEDLVLTDNKNGTATLKANACFNADSTAKGDYPSVTSYISVKVKVGSDLESEAVTINVPAIDLSLKQNGKSYEAYGITGFNSDNDYALYWGLTTSENEPTDGLIISGTKTVSKTTLTWNAKNKVTLSTNGSETSKLYVHCVLRVQKDSSTVSSAHAYYALSNRKSLSDLRSVNSWSETKSIYIYKDKNDNPPKPNGESNSNSYKHKITYSWYSDGSFTYYRARVYERKTGQYNYFGPKSGNENSGYYYFINDGTGWYWMDSTDGTNDWKQNAITDSTSCETIFGFSSDNYNAYSICNLFATKIDQYLDKK